jgi:glycosyltransferase involved in cell wall biosynthesis
MSHPKVTVIVPSYNHSHYLLQRVDSIVAQTFTDFELILLDDASTDDSLKKLLAYYCMPRVRIIVNAANSGSAFPQWEKGISVAKGDYVWIAESDDSADPRFLEHLVQLLDEHSDVGLAYCQSRLLNKEGSLIGTSVDWTSDLDANRWQSSYCNHGVDEIRKYLVKKNTIPNASAVLCRRSMLAQALPLDTSFKLCGDWLHWGKLLLRSDVAYTAEPLNDWRLESSNSRTRAPGLLEWKEGQRIIKHLASAVGYSENDTNSLMLSFADRCMTWFAKSVEPEGAPGR